MVSVFFPSHTPKGLFFPSFEGGNKPFGIFRSYNYISSGLVSNFRG